jgi:hypothetical protein
MSNELKRLRERLAWAEDKIAWAEERCFFRTLTPALLRADEIEEARQQLYVGRRDVERAKLDMDLAAKVLAAAEKWLAQVQAEARRLEMETGALILTGEEGQ